jgi:hypothetical protein
VINQSVSNFFQRTDIGRIDNDYVFITQDWDSRNSDVKHVVEQAWYMQP